VQGDAKLATAQQQIARLEKETNEKTASTNALSSEVSALKKSIEASAAEKKSLQARLAAIEEQSVSTKRELQDRVEALEQEAAQAKQDHEKTLQLYRYYLSLAAKVRVYAIRRDG
jgi:chromosome segregation ATPase